MRCSPSSPSFHFHCLEKIYLNVNLSSGSAGAFLVVDQVRDLPTAEVFGAHRHKFRGKTERKGKRREGERENEEGRRKRGREGETAQSR